MWPNFKRLGSAYDPRMQISKAQIAPIAAAIRSKRDGCNLLVFGCGFDSPFWAKLNEGGHTLFVEAVQSWADQVREKNPDLSILVEPFRNITVKSSLPVRHDLLEQYPLPEALKDRLWDVILVDAPAGYDANTPGRAVAIAWAGALADHTTHVFVHDAERMLETAYADALLSPRLPTVLSCPWAADKAVPLLRWHVGGDNAMTPIALTDHVGQRRPLRFLFQSERCEVLAFHDSLHVLHDLLRLRALHARSIVLLSSSWYRTPGHVRDLRESLETLSRVDTGRFSAARNVIILANSAEEQGRIAAALPDVTCLHVNNCCFLDETTFGIRNVDKAFDAILNSKPLAFKRHHLAAKVPNTVFLTYDAIEGEGERFKLVDLTAFNPATILANKRAEEVTEITQSARVGLILSAEEGACYASAEYLLSGLPVVSTRSVGGRDDFYARDTALVVEADPDAVKAGVEVALARLAAGAFIPERIRARTIERMNAFRATLATALAARMAEFGETCDTGALIEAAIRRGSKLAADRNFWVSGAARG